MAHILRRHKTGVSVRSLSPRRSEESQASQSTAPTSLYNSPTPSNVYTNADHDMSPCTTFYPRSSTETYTSTIASLEELSEEPDTYDPEYQIPDYRSDVVHSELRASTPSDFASYFPCTDRRLFIHHDDTTCDGNMNLRVDTEDRKKRAVQLFHLRMHDLKKREFSLRRYERSSGREVCHATRKYNKPAAQRPTFTRSVSNAFGMKKPDVKRTNSGMSPLHGRKSKKDNARQDPRYSSIEENVVGDDDDDDDNDDDDNDDKDDGGDDDVDYFMSKSSSKTKAAALMPTNTTKLEFSNYAQVEVKRRGAKSSKRYEFEYWGSTYTWKRVTKKEGSSSIEDVEYHLSQGDGSPSVAHIVPEMRTPSQIREEERNGGWVPPCIMMITDESVVVAPNDVADVIIATGLIALVDDCIKRHFHCKGDRGHYSHRMALPLTPNLNMEFVTPRAFLKAMIKRRDSGDSSKDREQQRSSPLRHASAVTAH